MDIKLEIGQLWQLCQKYIAVFVFDSRDLFFSFSKIAIVSGTNSHNMLPMYVRVLKFKIAADTM
jgi:hypothetical protein